jgi:pimeloyl-ACP methyl ester carboxylesterase
MKLLMDPAWAAIFLESLGVMFAQGVIGYVDDRLADGPGWGSFDVSAIRCPVLVLHGGSDSIVPVMQAHHTAKVVPGATLQIHDELGHFSIVDKILPAILTMRDG